MGLYTIFVTTIAERCYVGYAPTISVHTTVIEFRTLQDAEHAASSIVNARQSKLITQTVTKLYPPEEG